MVDLTTRSDVNAVWRTTPRYMCRHLSASMTMTTTLWRLAADAGTRLQRLTNWWHPITRPRRVSLHSSHSHWRLLVACSTPPQLIISCDTSDVIALRAPREIGYDSIGLAAWYQINWKWKQTSCNHGIADEFLLSIAIFYIRMCASGQLHYRPYGISQLVFVFLYMDFWHVKLLNCLLAATLQH